MKFIVLGAATIDLQYKLDKSLTMHDVVQATTCMMSPGGKAFNQAACLARLGQDVTLVSAIGSDTFGDIIVSTAEQEGIDTSLFVRVDDGVTDIITIIDQPETETKIIGMTTTTKTDQFKISNIQEVIVECDAILITCEIQTEIIQKIVTIASEAHKPIFLNPAPQQSLPQEILDHVKVLVPNLSEAQSLIGNTNITNATYILAELRKISNAEIICITLGEQGCIYSSRNQNYIEVSAHPTNVVDTTGASDAFCAVLAVSIMQQLDLSESIVRASIGASIACTVSGGYVSMPSLEKINSIQKDY